MRTDVSCRVRNVKAIIFDLDDTLVESTVDFPKFKRLVIEKIVSRGEREQDYNPNETVVATMNRYEDRMRKAGISNDEMKRRLAELDRIMDQVEMERVSDTVALDGAYKLLAMLREKGIKIGVLTRGCHDYAEAALRRTGLDHLVDALECRNSDSKPKPNPEAYLKLADRLGVGKDETIFVGDHPLDAQCAANAGVPFIAVGTGDIPDEVMRKEGSVEVFHDVRELLDWLEIALKD